MNEQNFNHLYQCRFEPSEKDQFLYSLAEQYETQCEAYDRMICSGKSERDGCALPINGRELGLINANATKVMRAILRGNPEVTKNELLQAIKKYNERR